jgi:curved DNA-binding protein CbpA
MAAKTLYSVLGVEPSAMAEDIDDGFNRLKRQYPQAKLDADEDARMRFLAIQQAYQTLGNPEARALYDQKLARAGIQVAPSYVVADEDPGWLSARNIAVAGIILILMSGMWFYHARAKAREERELATQILRLAEEEKRQAAEIKANEEARRQATFETSQERQIKNEERQFKLESERTARQASVQVQNAERQAEMERRREESARMQQQRQQLQQQQIAQQQAERAALQRLQNEKNQLREICRKQYNRSDC